MSPDCVALIPARSGSKRVPGKNTRPLEGHPLLAYSIASALRSGLFRAVVVSTDCEETAAIARKYGAEVPFLRPAKLAQDHSPDIDWIAHLLRELSGMGRPYDSFAILRPTSPFRTEDTIRRAWKQFVAMADRIDSLRAVEKCAQHPAKMWMMDGELMRPVMAGATGSAPWHSTPYQDLPEVWVQNASLEIAWSRLPLEEGSIAGRRIAPFLTEGMEGFDINHEEDWWLAEELLRRGRAQLARP